ncbi:hypothetical protein [Intrasporangium sp.]|uniref:hypothetical protein n=1 Tax=Intrasporangium sp. TaxID=1925024 RepID=UPI00293A5FAD|nr:hypothetical protein [Intrasporangium sp.]MDV3220580.1 hypothetical protein [Intrasporangium sp.]
MTTQTQLTASTRPTRKTRLRGPATAAAVTTFLVLGACSSEAPVTADPTRSATMHATASTTSSEPPASTTTTATTEPTPTPEAGTPTKRAVKLRIEDAALGHVISVTQVVRNLPWPSGNPIAEDAFEIVGIKVKLEAGDRYTAALSPYHLYLRLGSTDIRSTSEFGTTFDKDYGPMVKPAKRGETKSGWAFFKIEQGVSPLVLEYHRPAYKVSTTGKSIDAKDLVRKLTD